MGLDEVYLGTTTSSNGVVTLTVDMYARDEKLSFAHPSLTEAFEPVDLSEAHIEDMAAIGHPPADWTEAEKRQWYREAVEFSKHMQGKRREWE